MVLLWKAVVSEVGVQRVQTNPQNFWFSEINGAIRMRPRRGGHAPSPRNKLPNIFTFYWCFINFQQLEINGRNSETQDNVNDWPSRTNFFAVLLLKIWAKSLKIRVKWRSMLPDFKKWRPRFPEKHMKTFFGGHTKKRSFVGENL